MAGSEMEDRRRSRVALGATAFTIAATALALAAGGCGGSDDEGDDAAKAVPTETTQNLDPEPRRPGAEEIGYVRALELADKDNEEVGTGLSAKSKIREGIEDIQVSVGEVNGQSVCHELSRTAAVGVARTIGSDDADDCADAVKTAASKRRQADGTTALSEVLSVKARGDRATARIRNPDGATRHIAFVKEDGRLWRAASLQAIDPGLFPTSPEGPGHDRGDPRGADARAAIEEVLYDVEADLPLEDAEGVCSELTPIGRREIGGGVAFCEQRLPEIARRALLRGYQPHFSRFRSLEIRKRGAVAVVHSPGHGTRRVRFERTADGWKLPSIAYAGNVDRIVLREPVDRRDLAGVPVEAPGHDLGDEGGGGPKGDIREVVSDVQVDFAEGIGGVCPELSTGGQRELTGQRDPSVRDCTTVASRLSRQVRRSRTLAPWRSRIVSIDVRGKRATAVLTTPGRGRHRARFVDQPHAGWRLTSLRHLEPVAGLLER